MGGGGQGFRTLFVSGESGAVVEPQDPSKLREGGSLGGDGVQSSGQLEGHSGS
jgi:hypothetical protein